MVTNENILEKRAEIREFYEKQRATNGQPIRQNLRNQQNQRKFQNPKIRKFCGKRGHEMKFCHTLVRQQEEKFRQDEINASNLNSQNQYHPPNQHHQQQNSGQGSQDQRQMQYHAAIYQKSVHFEDHMNNQPNDYQRQDTTQSYCNEGRPSTPQNFTDQKKLILQ